MSFTRLVPADQVTSVPEEEAAPHLPKEEPSHTEWRVATPEEMSPTYQPTPEDRWPGEWHVFAWAIASGSAQRDIARELGYTEAWVSTVVNKPEVMQKINQIRDQHWSKNLDKRFANMAPKAADFMAQVIAGEGSGREAKISERLDASKWALEKVTGKAKQSGDADTAGTINNIFLVLDQLKAIGKSPEATTQEREVFEALSAPAKEADWMDEFVTKQASADREEKK